MSPLCPECTLRIRYWRTVRCGPCRNPSASQGQTTKRSNESRRPDAKGASVSGTAESDFLIRFWKDAISIVYSLDKGAQRQVPWNVYCRCQSSFTLCLKEDNIVLSSAVKNGIEIICHVLQGLIIYQPCPRAIEQIRDLRIRETAFHV